MARVKRKSTGAAEWGDLRLGALAWRPRTVVIDDSMTRRAFLADWLRANHFPVQTFVDGAPALAWLYHAEPEERPELILTDVRMPTLGGLELLRRMRLDDRFDGIAVLPYSSDVAKALAEELPSDPDEPAAEAAVEEHGGPELVLGIDQIPQAVARRVRRMAEARTTVPPRPAA